MIAPEIQVLIPCHSLEDFPTEQTDVQAASLLNAFAVAYHPRLLAWTGELPQWRRADDPPLARENQLILIPTVSDDWLPCGWVDEARKSGATVVTGISDRNDMVTAALAAVLPVLQSSVSAEQLAMEGEVSTKTDDFAGDPTAETERKSPFDPNNTGGPDNELVADFLALGTCWLLIELLTRRMRQFGNIEETRFFQRAQAAAKAAIADDTETAGTHLRACFEILLEARERFYPVECYLLDLCLVVPDVEHDRLHRDCQDSAPFSVLVSADDFGSICEKKPELGPAFAEAWQAGRISLIGGEDRETSLPLLPQESALFHFEQGRQRWRKLLGRAPTVWGRRRFGLSALLPQLLVKFGYKAALHVVLDDGIYPDAEYTKLRWRGVDGTLIDALSRIPLAADGAASYLRLPLRMSESMDHDQVAGLVLARWPEVSAPWFDDLRRSQKYAPCLGRFVTFDRFFEQTELPGQLSNYKAGEYFSPILIQHVARREDQPISRYSAHADRRRRFDTARWCRATAAVLQGKAAAAHEDLCVEQQIEAAAPTAKPNSIEVASGSLCEFEQTAPNELCRIIMHSAKAATGFLILNPLSFTRRVVVLLPTLKSPLAIEGPVKAVEFDAAHPDRTACVVELPACGYAWISSENKGSMPATPKVPLAEGGLLRNDQFEVAINDRTGGIAHVRFHHQRSKRLSQQLSFRFSRERAIVPATETEDEVKSRYAEMRCRGREVVRSGTACGEIATWGEIVDQTNGEKLALFRQSVRVWRALPTIEIEIELSDVKRPDGDPWNCYFASRFAWNDITAAVTRSIYHSAHGFTGERFETSDYIEIASDDERLTIVPHGLPFHRKSGDRMVDSLLVVAGETQSRFRFTISVDTPYPLEAAWNATTPFPTVRTESGPPRSGSTGWFFQLDSRNVQLTRILDVYDSGTEASPLEQYEHSTVPADPGFAVRLVETEGITKTVKLRCFRSPTFARKRDFQGETINDLLIENDAVLIEVTSFETVDVELRFGKQS